MRKADVVILTLETEGTVGLSLAVGFSIQGEAMDVARSAPQGARYHEDVTCSLKWELRRDHWFFGTPG